MLITACSFTYAVIVHPLCFYLRVVSSDEEDSARYSPTSLPSLSTLSVSSIFYNLPMPLPYPGQQAMGLYISSFEDFFSGAFYPCTFVSTQQRPPTCQNAASLESKLRCWGIPPAPSTTSSYLISWHSNEAYDPEFLPASFLVPLHAFTPLPFHSIRKGMHVFARDEMDSPDYRGTSFWLGTVLAVDGGVKVKAPVKSGGKKKVKQLSGESTESADGEEHDGTADAKLSGKKVGGKKQKVKVEESDEDTQRVLLQYVNDKWPACWTPAYTIHYLNINRSYLG